MSASDGERAGRSDLTVMRPTQELTGPERLDRITSWLSDDPTLSVACAAAVDPVEIAARLESHGVSSQVAVDTFGYADVFSTAEAVYREMPFHDVVPPAPSVPAGGGPVDLLRGALYALPALFLPVVVTGFGLRLSWWVLPVGLTMAWGTSQAAATCAWTMLGRKDRRSDALMALATLVVTGLACLAAALVACWTLGGNESSAVTVAGIGVYVAASAIMVFQQSELLLALCMVPAVVGSVLALGHLPVDVGSSTAAWCVVATVGLAAVVANRFVPTDRWRRPGLARADWVRAAKFLAYGISCGVLLGTLIGFASAVNGSARALSIAVWPLLLTLGLMEWQLRSFRSRATAALSASFDLVDFGHRVGQAFRRSIGLYVGALAVLSVVCLIAGRQHHLPEVPLLLASVGTLGVAFFMALLLACSGRINLVLRCWAVTFVVLGTALAIDQQIRGHIAPMDGLLSLLVATGTAIVLFLVLARSVLASPLSY
jgi:hypothetical protein